MVSFLPYCSDKSKLQNIPIHSLHQTPHMCSTIRFDPLSVPPPPHTNTHLFLTILMSKHCAPTPPFKIFSIFLDTFDQAAIILDLQYSEGVNSTSEVGRGQFWKNEGWWNYSPESSTTSFHLAHPPFPLQYPVLHPFTTTPPLLWPN